MTRKGRTCYLMVRDIEGQEDEAALEWGVEFGLDDGEELPEDVEQLSEAQFTILSLMRTLEGTFKNMDSTEIKGEKGSGILIHSGNTG